MLKGKKAIITGAGGGIKALAIPIDVCDHEQV